MESVSQSIRSESFDVDRNNSIRDDSFDPSSRISIPLPSSGGLGSKKNQGLEFTQIAPGQTLRRSSREKKQVVTTYNVDAMLSY